MDVDYYTVLEKLFNTLTGVAYRLIRAIVVLLVLPLSAPWTLMRSFTTPGRREVGPITTAVISIGLLAVLCMHLYDPKLIGISSSDTLSDPETLRRMLQSVGNEDPKTIGAIALGIAVSAVLTLVGLLEIVTLLLSGLGVDLSPSEAVTREGVRGAAIYSLSNVVLGPAIFFLFCYIMSMFEINVLWVLYKIFNWNEVRGLFSFLADLFVAAIAGLLIPAIYAVIDGVSLAGRFHYSLTGWKRRVVNRVTAGALIAFSLYAAAGAGLAAGYLMIVQSGLLDESSYVAAARCERQGNHLLIYAEIRNDDGQALLLLKDDSIATTVKGKDKEYTFVSNALSVDDGAPRTYITIPARDRRLVVIKTHDVTEAWSVMASADRTCEISLHPNGLSNGNNTVGPESHRSLIVPLIDL